jgi:O-acetyl-ADP-ribose deacetylase (regulator of RNase III)
MFEPPRSHCGRVLFVVAIDAIHMEFEVIQGDIAQQSADVLVNAANTSLRMGSGVAGALKATGGQALNDEAVSKGPVDLGDVAVTDAYDLDAEYVVHAAGMPPGGSATAGSIRDATRNALARADELGAQSMVVPGIGTGIAGFSTRKGYRIICEEIDAFEPDSLSDVRFIAYSDDGYRTLQAVADEVRGE